LADHLFYLLFFRAPRRKEKKLLPLFPPKGLRRPLPDRKWPLYPIHKEGYRVSSDCSRKRTRQRDEARIPLEEKRGGDTFHNDLLTREEKIPSSAEACGEEKGGEGRRATTFLTTLTSLSPIPLPENGGRSSASYYPAFRARNFLLFSPREKEEETRSCKGRTFFHLERRGVRASILSLRSVEKDSGPSLFL